MDPSLQPPIDQPLARRYSVRRASIVMGATVGVFAATAAAVWFVRSVSAPGPLANGGSAAASNFPVATVPVSSLPSLPTESQVNQLVVNGQAQVTDGLVLLPSTTKPGAAVAGELYYDKATNQPYFYNGSGFVSLQGASATYISNTYVTNNTVTGSGGPSGSFVTLQGSTPGVPDAGDFNVTGTGTVGTLRTNAAVVKGDSVSVFQVQSSAGVNLLAADTANDSVVLSGDGTPAPVTIRMGAASGNNATGADLTIDASNGTGYGTSGNVIFRTAGPSGMSILNGDNTEFEGYAQASLSTTFAVTSHPNMVMIVGVVQQDPTQTVTSISWNGSTAGWAKIGSVASASGGGAVELWYLVNPTSGSNTLIVNFLDTAGVNHQFVGASTYYNVNQTTPIAASNTATSTSSTSSVSVPTSLSQVVVDAVSNTSFCLGTPGAAQSRVWADVLGPNTIFGGSYKTAVSTTTTMTWAQTSPCPWSTVAAVLNTLPSSTPDILTDRLHISGSGNIGINNADPQYTLDVGGSGNFKVTSATAFRIQNASGASLFTADTGTMTVTVATLSVTGTLTLNGHVITAGTTPVVAAGAAACTSPITGVTGNDTAGQITITVGTGCAGGGTLVDLTFSSAYGAVPYVQITPGNTGSAALLPYQSATATGFTVGVANSPTSSTTYLFDYLVTQ